MDKDGWKILACLLAVVIILETIGVFVVYSIGSSMLDAEKNCAITCSEYTGCNSYLYDEQTEKCMLYHNGEIIKVI